MIRKRQLPLQINHSTSVLHRWVLGAAQRRGKLEKTFSCSTEAAQWKCVPKNLSLIRPSKREKLRFLLLVDCEQFEVQHEALMYRHNATCKSKLNSNNFMLTTLEFIRSTIWRFFLSLAACLFLSWCALAYQLSANQFSKEHWDHLHLQIRSSKSDIIEVVDNTHSPDCHMPHVMVMQSINTVRVVCVVRCRKWQLCSLCRIDRRMRIDWYRLLGERRALRISHSNRIEVPRANYDASVRCGTNINLLNRFFSFTSMTMR